MILVANKTDLEGSRAVKTSKGKKVLNSSSLLFPGADPEVVGKGDNGYLGQIPPPPRAEHFCIPDSQFCL